MKIKKMIIITWVALAAVGALADNLTVDLSGTADFTSIQSALDFSSAGDVITVAPGVYEENIYFHGKAVTLTGQDPDDPNIVSQTVIDGGRWDSVVTFAWGEGPDSVIAGLTLTNGSSLFGGGICCWQSSPTIVKNHIFDNRSWADFAAGGGIYCYQSEALIKSNVINWNQLYGDEVTGGGICLIESQVRIVQNEISSNLSGHSEYNEALPIGYGGGIYCEDSHVNIADNVLLDNDSIIGHGIYGAQVNGVIEKNNINRMSYSGGGRNISQEQSYNIDGGGIYITNSGHGEGLRVKDNTIRVTAAACDFECEADFTVKSRGMGIFCNNSVIDVIANSINHCIVRFDAYSNTGAHVQIDVKGVGFYCESSTVDFLDNVIKDVKVQVSARSGGEGGSAVADLQGMGIFCQSSTLNISNNIISSGDGHLDVYAPSGLETALLEGGGVFCDASTVELKNNRITENFLGVSSYYGNNIFVRGAGVSLANTLSADPETTVMNNCIVLNYFFGSSMDNAGGGIYCGSGTSPAIILNTIVANRANQGAGIFIQQDSRPTINNNIIVKNERGGGVFWKYTEPLSFSYNCLWGNVGGDYAGWAAPGEGDISTDPLFANVSERDYHLKSAFGRWDSATQSWVFDELTSPCINAGLPKERCKPEPKPNGKRVNMGAYGKTPQASKSPDEPLAYCKQKIPADGNGDCRVDSADLQITAFNWLDPIPLEPGMKEQWRKSDIQAVQMLSDSTDCLYVLDSEAIITKYDPNGLALWTFPQVGDMVVDPNGTVYCIGYTFNKLDIDGNLIWSIPIDSWKSITDDRAGNIYLIDQGYNNYSVTKYDPNGTQLLKVVLEEPENYYFGSVVPVIGGPGLIYFVFNGSYDDYQNGEWYQFFGIQAYDASGDLMWDTLERLRDDEWIDINDSSVNENPGVVDSSGNLCLTYLKSYADGTNWNSVQITEKYDPTGTKQWSKEYSHGLETYFLTVNTDEIDNILISGSEYESWSQDGSQSFITIKYDPDGNEKWVTQYKGDPENYGHVWNLASTMLLDNSGNIYVGGESSHWDDERGMVLMWDVVKYDPAGQQVWALSLPLDYPRMAVTGSGDIYCSAYDFYTDLPALYKYSPANVCAADQLHDANVDCYIDLADYAAIAANWLECDLEPNSACWQYE